MRVLVGCEMSGVVRDAFAKLGHDAWSCDLMDCERGGNHLKMDVFEAIENHGPWDIGIFHPPCDYLTVSGNKWFKDDIVASTGVLTGEARRQARDQAVEFVKRLWSCAIPKVAIENPIGRLSTLWMKPTQTVQPWMFGHAERKATCLWLRGLPPLTETNNVEEEMLAKPEKEQHRLHWLTPGKQRKIERSRTFEGAAGAMANQWGGLK